MERSFFIGFCSTAVHPKPTYLLRVYIYRIVVESGLGAKVCAPYQARSSKVVLLV